ncbi:MULTISPECIES: hypothetical protein [Bradyrhizobium]|nr:MULTISPECIES: hypothetical protein [Bradyrhizobium]MCG2629382.1 hypothetical protein [Bradyrhizobium zhengyangense]MCG2644663.1 hypothetical protein [Bradyrhizobium zhengyangense]MCG2670896.1 hypothetical protein [Bradyrhizobium zhengyangense]MDN4984529.1 hypothetical protein [Bradyrhizobium sp. WYCCWR 13022]MDN5002521.1 hypothetical protein [Bradyrhizobium sp. WYCCWR 12677]
MTEVNRELLYGPFEKATGIQVVPVIRSASPTTQIKSMVETKNYMWDCVFGAGADESLQWQQADLLEPLNVSGEFVDQIPEEMRHNPSFMPDISLPLLWYAFPLPPRRS